MDDATLALVQLMRGLQPPLPDEYCLPKINWWVTCLTKSEWASWVQALGSVAAIYFAGHFARKQWNQLVQREDARDKAHEWQRMTVLIELADYAVALVAAVPDPSRDDVDKPKMKKFFESYRHLAFDEASEALRRFGPEHLPNGQALVHVIEIIRCLSDIKDPIESVHGFAHGSVEAKQAVWRDDVRLNKIADIQGHAETARIMLRNIRTRYQK